MFLFFLILLCSKCNSKLDRFSKFFVRLKRGVEKKVGCRELPFLAWPDYEAEGSDAGSNVFLGFRYLRHITHIPIILRVYSSRQRITFGSVFINNIFIKWRWRSYEVNAICTLCKLLETLQPMDGSK